MTATHSGIIALITDFGLQDEYVGVMKGAILSVNPRAVVVDVCHAIEPQNVEQAGRMLSSAVAYFPEGTVFTVVVDPGVGGDRDILAARREGVLVLAPDNGILSVFGDGGPWEAVVRVRRSRYFRPRVSRTFHGRDIFAPVSAHLSLGLPPAELGDPVDPSAVRRIDWPAACIQGDGTIRGRVVAVDRFGNLVTDVPATLLVELQGSAEDPAVGVEIAGRVVHGLRTHYGAEAPGRPLALIGSRDTLEIAVNGGSAAAAFGAESGTEVIVRKGG